MESDDYSAIWNTSLSLAAADMVVMGGDLLNSILLVVGACSFSVWAKMGLSADQGAVFMNMHTCRSYSIETGGGKVEEEVLGPHPLRPRQN